MEVAYAADLINSSAYEINDIIRVFVALIVLMSGLLAVVFIIWWGVMLILSGGKDDKVKPAINSIRYAVVGLLVIILSLFIAPKVGDILNLNISQYISPDAIFQTIQDLSGKIFGNKSTIDLGGNSSSTSVDADFTDL